MRNTEFQKRDMYGLRMENIYTSNSLHHHSLKGAVIGTYAKFCEASQCLLRQENT